MNPDLPPVCRVAPRSNLVASGLGWRNELMNGTVPTRNEASTPRILVRAAVLIAAMAAAIGYGLPLVVERAAAAFR